MPTNRTRVAIASIWDAHDSYACALLLWCQNAAAFGKLLASASLVASTADVDTVLLLSGGTADEQRRARDTVREDCTDSGGNLQIHTPAEDLKDAVDAFVQRGGCRETDKLQGKGKPVPRSRLMDVIVPSAAPMLFKWHFFSLVEYSLVLFADLDVQLLRPEQPLGYVAGRWRRGWSRAVPPDGSTRFLGVGDNLVPLNAGLWTIGHPSVALYEDGLRQLRRVPFNSSHGFGLLGPPRRLKSDRATAWLKPFVQKRLMQIKDSWWPPAVPFGDCDQGFLFYMVHVRSKVAGPMDSMTGSASLRTCRYSPASPEAESCAHTARHHTGQTKPWVLVRSTTFDHRGDGHPTNGGRVAQYLNATRFLHLVGRSRCAARFASWLPLLPPAVPLGTYLRHHGRQHRGGP